MTTPREPASPPAAPPPRDFDRFFLDEYPRLVALCVAITSDREAARDIAQESLLRTFRDWDRVSAMDRPGAWARRVAINLATDRGRRRRTERAGLLRLRREVSAQEAAIEPDFWDAVAELPERQRTAVALYYVVDRSVDQIADVMGVHPGTVKATLFEARHTLARRLQIEETP